MVDHCAVTCCVFSISSTRSSATVFSLRSNARAKSASAPLHTCTSTTLNNMIFTLASPARNRAVTAAAGPPAPQLRPVIVSEHDGLAVAKATIPAKYGAFAPLLCSIPVLPHPVLASHLMLFLLRARELQRRLLQSLLHLPVLLLQRPDPPRAFSPTTSRSG